MNYYDLCCQHKGQVVQIKENCGTVHVGKISQVDPTYVWLERSNTTQGFGYGYGYGYGGPSQYGYGQSQGYGQYSYGGYSGYNNHYQYGGYPAYGSPRPGYGSNSPGNPNIFPVALAGIGGFALGSAFFW